MSLASRGASTPPPDELARWKRRVIERAPRLELISLIEILASRGYGWDELRFASYPSAASPAGLVREVEFLDEPRQVRLSLNLGLLSAQSPLPSYFWKRMDEPGFDAHAFTAFLGFLDHVVISKLLVAIYPELNRQLHHDWERWKRRELQLLDLRSPATLHWLFETAFPELEVLVEKALLDREVSSGALQLGVSQLGGDAVFGRKASVPVQGRRVTLTASTERAGSGQPWSLEIQGRLDQTILPILRSVGVDLQVFLVIREQEAWARLDSQSYLGYDSVRGGQQKYRRIELHRGHAVE